MVFSYEALKHNTLSEDNIIVSEDTSLFTFGLDVLRESNTEIRNILQNIYIESGYNLNEAFKEKFTENFSFKNIIKTIIKFFIDGIKKIFNEFKAIISKFIYSDKTIDKYKDKIIDFKDEIKYTGDYFRYSHLDAIVPSIDDYFEFFENYDSVMDDLKKVFEKKDKNIIINTLQTKKNDLSASLVKFYDNVRKNMFSRYSNEVGVITEHDFATIVYKFFRSGDSIPMNNATLKNADIIEALERFNRSKQMTKDTEKEMKYIESKSNAEIKRIEKILPEDIMKDYVPIDYELEFHLDNYLKVKCGQLQQICTIYTSVYSAKLDAIKTALVQDKKVLFEVIGTIIKKEGL